ncbi:GGDEF domain-containing protein [Salidesulfovibrio onnuriiensis]|uniref:GGDEF domain-containing protein n=1 Tax=Salidesulfovibrio onnuriiensis TaxID=2583823 RepID=UPI00164FA75A|nr:GGDEF domain-containing protein [Salidesulfovibrio onnuriiensis]
MPKTDISEKILEHEVLMELNSLQKELCTRANEYCLKLDPEPALCLFRLFPGISMTEWEDISRRHDLKQWLTLPIDGDAYPHLKQVQETMERLSYQTDHDPLTGLANRRAFDRILDIEIERSRRAGTSVSLAIIDLDDFKQVNDTYGHTKGDEVLVAFSRKVFQTTRRYDLAARLGGEEFALVLSGTGLVKAKRVLNRLLEEFRNKRFESPEGETFSVTCSVGLTCYKGTVDMDVKQLIDLADEALYKAKEQGKDQVLVSRIPDIDLVPQETLVQANEKQFLFGK